MRTSIVHDPYPGHRGRLARGGDIKLEEEVREQFWDTCTQTHFELLPDLYDYIHTHEKYTFYQRLQNCE